jgi:hypothetical protein
MSDGNATQDARRAAAARYAHIVLAEQARVGVPPDARSLVRASSMPSNAMANG